MQNRQSDSQPEIQLVGEQRAAQDREGTFAPNRGRILDRGECTSFAILSVVAAVTVVCSIGGSSGFRDDLGEFEGIFCRSSCLAHVTRLYPYLPRTKKREMHLARRAISLSTTLVASANMYSVKWRIEPVRNTDQPLLGTRDCCPQCFDGRAKRVFSVRRRKMMRRHL